MSSIEAFVGHIRHELRTPVNAILGYSQLLLEEDDASLTVEERHDLERVTEAGHQLLRIVVEALDPAELIGDDVAMCAVRLRHALHTPLTTVQGLVYLLIEEHEDAPICADLRRIDAAAVRLAELSDSIEHLYRVRLGAASAGPPSALAATSTPSTVFAENPEGSAVRSGSILVIDDEEINRHLLTRRLTHHGHVVLTADNLIAPVLGLTKCRVPIGYFALGLVARSDYTRRETAEKKFWTDWRLGKVEDGLLQDARYVVVNKQTEGIPPTIPASLSMVFENSEFAVFKVDPQRMSETVPKST